MPNPRAVLRDDPASGFEGHQSVDPSGEGATEGVDLQVQAIWSAILHEWELRYVNPPPKLTENCGFWEAVEVGRENLRPKREFHSMVDGLSARFDRVTPLPIGEARL